MATGDVSRFVRCLRMQRISSTEESELYETLERSFAASLMTKDYAFGGVTAAQAVMAAHHSLHAKYSQQSAKSHNAHHLTLAEAIAVDKNWAIYSCLGTFLGPTTTTSLVRLEVTTLRSTRSFETKLVRAMQQQPAKKGQRGAETSGAKWTTRFVCTIDFCRRGAHAKHPITGDTLAFSVTPHALQQQEKLGATPSLSASFDPEAAQSIFAVADRLLKEGTLTAQQHKLFNAIFGTLPDCMEMRWLPGGLCERTLQGMRPDFGKEGQATSDYVDASKNVDGAWFKTYGPLRDVWHDKAGASELTLPMSPAALGAAFRTMMLDPRPVVSAPLVHQLMFGHTYIGQSLDTAIRFHTQESEQDVQATASDFHYVETISRVGGHGRYFGESSCFDRSGRLIATCSQQCSLQTMRPKSVDNGSSQAKDGKVGTGKMAKL